MNRSHQLEHEKAQISHQNQRKRTEIHTLAKENSREKEREYLPLIGQLPLEPWQRTERRESVEEGERKKSRENERNSVGGRDL